MTTRHIGIREFRDQATRFIASGEMLAIERHGGLVGYFVPVPPRGVEGTIDQAIDRLRSEAREDVLTSLRARRNEILEVTARYGASNVRIFGSVVRGEATQHSDVDFLIDLEPGRTLLDLSGLICDLQDSLGRPVDVVIERSLKPYLRERILGEAESL